MKAKDVMTRPVITVSPETEVQEIARLLLESRVSAVPVVDEHDRIVGIVSEGDLISHAAAGTAEPHRRSWWLDFFASSSERAQNYVKHHGRFAREVMTRDVVTVTEDTPLAEIAHLLESRHIKRVPVVRDGVVVGIVSRANLLQGLAAARPQMTSSQSDSDLRDTIEAALKEAGVDQSYLNVIVTGRVAHLWGAVASREELDALKVVLENTQGLEGVENQVIVLPGRVVSAMGGV